MLISWDQLEARLPNYILAHCIAFKSTRACSTCRVYAASVPRTIDKLSARHILTVLLHRAYASY